MTDHDSENGDPRLANLIIPAPPTQPVYSLSTHAIHADDAMNSYTDVAPALHVSTTFRYAHDPDKLSPPNELLPPHRPGEPVAADSHIYSRATAPNTSRLELQLTALLGAPALVYSSGLAAFHALLIHLHPKVVAVGAGYHGCHGVLSIYQRLTKCKIVDLFDEKSWDAAGLGTGDVVHLETPVNPTGLAYDIADFAERAHKRGAVLTIDATFAPPPLQDPLAFGADYIMHSGTKYFGGHSDMLCGVIAIGRHRAEWEEAYWGMFRDRIHLGSVMGSLEGWLGVRSLRTLELRVHRQSDSAGRIVAWLAQCLDGTSNGNDHERGRTAVQATVAEIHHASLQHDDMSWLAKQMPNGFGPVFAMSMRSEKLARRLPSKLALFHHATSLGGVESLIEWRRMSDSTVEPTLLRVSVGVEGWEDLKADLIAGFEALAAEDKDS